MDANIINCLTNLKTVYKLLDYKGEPITYSQAKLILSYGLIKGYKNISEITEEDQEQALKGGLM